MLLRRIAEHLRAQNWFAVALDFVIVVVGVFIGVQAANWNEARAAHESERAFIGMVRDTIVRNADDMQGYLALLDSDLAAGMRAAQMLERPKSCMNDCWRRIVDLFIASQWVDVRGDRTAFDEIQRTGLPRDRELKASIMRYYGLQDQVAPVAAELPEFRALVRSIIPARVQQHYWTTCFRAEGRRQFHDANCPSPVSEEEAAAIYGALHDDARLGRALNYWLSTVSVLKVALETQLDETEAVLTTIDRHLGAR